MVETIQHENVEDTKQTKPIIGDYMIAKETKNSLLKELHNRYGSVVTRKEIQKTVEELKMKWPHWLFQNSETVERGAYNIAGLITALPKAQENVEEVSDKDLAKKIAEKFEAMKIMTRAAAKGVTRALIISGPSGLGKTHEVLAALKQVNAENVLTFDEKKDKICGFVRATGLYKALYEHQNQNQVLVFDDADSIFFDDACLNLLKAACDTTEKRYISWRSETHMSDDLGETLPNYFEFNGTIIFITNYDFTNLIAKGNKLSPHFEALISRAHYIDLDIKTSREKMIRITQVMSSVCGNLSQADQTEILNYLTEHKDNLKDLSLRKVIKLGQLKKIASNWKTLANTIA